MTPEQKFLEYAIENHLKDIIAPIARKYYLAGHTAGAGNNTDTNYQTAYVPCDEHDPDVSGGYTSTDGQSLGYVKEIKILSSNTNRWVKASEMESFKEGWHLGKFNLSPCVIDVNNGDLIVTLPNGLIQQNPPHDRLRFLVFDESESPSQLNELEELRKENERLNGELIQLKMSISGSPKINN